MVVSEKVEDAVDRQEQDHFLFVQTEAGRLVLSRFNGNDYIAEEIGVEAMGFPFSHWEGKDIGGFIPAEMTTIQLLNLGIIDKGNAEFSIRQGQVGQYRSNRPSYFS